MLSPLATTACDWYRKSLPCLQNSRLLPFLTLRMALDCVENPPTRYYRVRPVP